MKLVAWLAVAGGVLWYFYRTNPAFAQALSSDAQALQNTYDAARGSLAAGNAPTVQPAGFFGSAAGIGAVDSAVVGVTGALAAAGAFGGAIVGGIVTAGVGFAVAFVSYELLKQRASMRTNDVRDAWQKQFVTLADALGLNPPKFPSGPGGGGFSPGDDGASNGSVEMAIVIFAFDHDSSQRLWHAVTDTQDETQFRRAAQAVDQFLYSRGVPVQGIQ